MQTREQLYARKVYDLVDAHRLATEPVADAMKEQHAELKKKRKRYGSMAHKLPVLIRTAGLAQAIAFVSARGKDEHILLLSHLNEVLRTTGSLGSGQSLDGPGQNGRSRAAGIEEYTRLTEESLMALLWFKRYAQSILKVEITDEAEEEEDLNDPAGS
jgi:CRISPR-associated protein Cmr5